MVVLITIDLSPCGYSLPYGRALLNNERKQERPGPDGLKNVWNIKEDICA
jgi:hypothetical protein